MVARSPLSYPAHVTTFLLLIAALTGLGLSIVSYIQYCLDACADTASFTLFGFDFGLFGILFFCGLTAVVILRHRLPLLATLCPLMLCAAAGAEAHFTWIQKYVIGSWCPLCLGIAAAVFAGLIIVCGEQLRELQTKGGTMHQYLRRAALGIAALAVGLSVSVVGVKQETATAASSAMDLYLGKTNSPVTVYFISDWFCPACRKAEKAIETMYPAVSRKARVTFIDYPIHPESNNFTPYNLQFLAHEKKQYLKLRGALAALSLKTKTPSPAEVQAAVQPYGVTLRQINYADVMYGMQFNLTTYRGFGVKGTPAVVVANGKTRKFSVLDGASAITREKVLAAIAELSR